MVSLPTNLHTSIKIFTVTSYFTSCLLQNEVHKSKDWTERLNDLRLVLLYSIVYVQAECSVKTPLTWWSLALPFMKNHFHWKAEESVIPRGRYTDITSDYTQRWDIIPPLTFTIYSAYIPVASHVKYHPCAGSFRMSRGLNIHILKYVYSTLVVPKDLHKSPPCSQPQIVSQDCFLCIRTGSLRNSFCKITWEWIHWIVIKHLTHLSQLTLTLPLLQITLRSWIISACKFLAWRKEL